MNRERRYASFRETEQRIRENEEDFNIKKSRVKTGKTKNAILGGLVGGAGLAGGVYLHHRLSGKAAAIKKLEMLKKEGKATDKDLQTLAQLKKERNANLLFAGGTGAALGAAAGSKMRSKRYKNEINSLEDQRRAKEKDIKDGKFSDYEYGFFNSGTPINKWGMSNAKTGAVGAVAGLGAGMLAKRFGPGASERRTLQQKIRMGQATPAEIARHQQLNRRANMVTGGLAVAGGLAGAWQQNRVSGWGNTVRDKASTGWNNVKGMFQKK